MAIKFPGDLPLGTTFNVNSSKPLDSRVVVEEIADLTNVNTWLNGSSFVGYLGLTVYVEEDQNIYSLIEISGSTLTWKNQSDSSTIESVNGQTGIVNLTAEDVGAISNSEKENFVTQEQFNVGIVNIMRNTGFTGNYENVSVETMVLSDDLPVFSPQLENWNGTGTVSDNYWSTSGKTITGEISQEVNIVPNEMHVISLRGQNGTVEITINNENVVSWTLDSEPKDYSFKFLPINKLNTIKFKTTGNIGNIKLERGSVKTDHTFSPLDNDKSILLYQALNYFIDAIKNGNTTNINGLILKSLFQVGQFNGEELQKITAGISGVYNEDSDVAMWAGGTFEQAIQTITKFKQNPYYNPTDEEWENLANWVVTHGGETFMRGYIYALGGYFRGTISNQGTTLRPDGSISIANDRVYWDKFGNQYEVSPARKVWRKIAEEMINLVDDKFILDLLPGTYLESSFAMGTATPETDIVTLPLIDLNMVNNSHDYQITVRIVDPANVSRLNIELYFDSQESQFKILGAKIDENGIPVPIVCTEPTYLSDVFKNNTVFNSGYIIFRPVELSAENYEWQGVFTYNI